MSQALDDDADPTFTHFAHRDGFLALLRQFLDIPLRRDTSVDDEDRLVEELGAILDYYLPLPGLLDPHLDEVVPPLMDKLGRVLEQIIEDDGVSICSARLARLGRVINWVVKVRGWKSVVPHFPSSLDHLSILVQLLSPPNTPSTSRTPSTPHHPLLSTQDAWELRAVLLLWLALLLTVPFSLSTLSHDDHSFPSGIDLPAQKRLFARPTTPLATRVILLALPFLQKPGNEGSYAALVFARLYSRTDTVDGLPGFFDWYEAEIEEGEREGEANLVASVLEMLAILPMLLPPSHLPILSTFLDDSLLAHLRSSQTAASSGLIRKLAVKAKGRWWIARLGSGVKEDNEVPNGLEEVLDELMSGLSDKDTIVRYSSAKYLARLAHLLPRFLADEIAQATISLFSGTEDEPTVESSFGTVIDPGGTSKSTGTMGFGGLETARGEARWHGLCLALAEMARRGTLHGEHVGEAVKWALKALTFDLRRASHSIGANVRDAAAYLLWSLSRACPPEQLATYAEDMATVLACVACLDREVGVRRAASAGFQEGVGRLGLYPEGIDVLGKTDFYSVSVRRVAFTTAAPAVAVHEVYRGKLRNHLHRITLRHWDAAMRHFGAQTLYRIVALDATVLDDSVSREVEQLASLDPANVHGALVALTQLAPLLGEDDPRRSSIFEALSSIRPAAFISQNAPDMLQAACQFITAYLSTSLLDIGSTTEVLGRFAEMGSRRKEGDVQEAVAAVYERLSELKNCAVEVTKLITDLKSIRAPQRQTAAVSLGRIHFGEGPDLVAKASKALLYQLDMTAKADIETRRYAVLSLGRIACQKAVKMDIADFQQIVTACTASLDDYSTDQRGDVGSWIRIAGLTSIGGLIHFAAGGDLPTEFIPQEMFEQAVGGVLKQGMERLEPVREAAARALHEMRAGGAAQKWQWEGVAALQIEANLDTANSFRYSDQGRWFATAMPLLRTTYRKAVVSGLILTTGSQVESVSKLALNPLVEALSASEDVMELVLRDMLDILTKTVNTNRVFLPGLITATKLSRSSQLHWSTSISASLAKILALGSKGIPQMKSIERITASLKLCVACLTHVDLILRKKAAAYLPLFLGHRFPRIRALAAESVYLELSKGHEEMSEDLEEILLETGWTDEGIGGDEGRKVVDLILSGFAASKIEKQA